MTDQPIAYTVEGRPLFDNTPTVVCVIVENIEGRVLAVRRANEPGKGLLGLPGGYHMRGESWQKAGVREVMEETGVDVNDLDLDLMSMETDDYGNNLVIARSCMTTSQTGRPVDGEALEIIWLDHSDLREEEWAFPLHLSAVREYFYLHHLRSAWAR